MTIDTIITFVTFVITYIFGELSKKFNWVESQYIPIQNIVIGIIASAVYYFFLDNSNVGQAIIVIFSALASAGFYDLTKTNGKG